MIPPEGGTTNDRNVADSGPESAERNALAKPVAHNLTRRFATNRLRASVGPYNRRMPDAEYIGSLNRG